MSDLPKEFGVRIPADATTAEEDALVEAERDRIVDAKIEKDIDDLLAGF